MNSARLGAAALLGLLALNAAGAGAAPADEKPLVVIDTTLGPITVELDPAKAPASVDNFLKYVDANFYDNLTFHRVIPGFMVQGGGLDDKLNEKEAGKRAPIKNESANGLSNKRGTIAMARTGDPNSATCQWYINLVDNARGLDAQPAKAGYAVFGTVVDGMNVVDAIAKVDTGAKRDPGGRQMEDVPLKPVYIQKVFRKPKS